jgi:hypothetical protein
LQKALPDPKKPSTWVNVGGQLIQKESLDNMIFNIRSGKITSWNDIHQFYKTEAEMYALQKMLHAIDVLYQVHDIKIKNIGADKFRELLNKSESTADWITKGIFNSRQKDYLNPFRKMVYENQAEMDQVIGKLDDNSFIKNQQAAFQRYQSSIRDIIISWKLE